jgi:hypothetical protein
MGPGHRVKKTYGQEIQPCPTDWRGTTLPRNPEVPMRLMLPLLFGFLPAAAFANCAAEMRICTFSPVNGGPAQTRTCSFTQCASVDTVFDYFRFADGSYARFDYTVAQTLMETRLSFGGANGGPANFDAIAVKVLDTAADQRGFQSGAVGAFVTSPCNASCSGLDADSFGR